MHEWQINFAAIADEHGQETAEEIRYLAEDEDHQNQNKGDGEHGISN